jgi:hypothetical protein
MGLPLERAGWDEDGVDESPRDSFAHQKSEISGDAVSPPYCAPCPLARIAVLLERGGLSACIQLSAC